MLSVTKFYLQVFNNKMNTGLWLENLKISWRSINSNTLRTVLTVLIIAFGIMALVGILTATDAIKGSISSSFERMGANSFSIQQRGLMVNINGRSSRIKNYSYIPYRQAIEFKEQFHFPALVSVSVNGSGMATVKYRDKKTDPNIRVIGGDENYLNTSGNDISQGRNFSLLEINQAKHLVIIGDAIARKLFKNESQLQKIISIGNGKYKIIGVLSKKGSSMGFNEDEVCIIPVSNVKQYFSRPNMSFNINILPHNGTLQEIAIGEAEASFRKIRKLDAGSESDFYINKSDNLAQMLLDNIKYVTTAAIIIGVITLFGAAIGLMNIMLVAVSERTREIGIRKAIGASSKIIKQQFLFESVFIGQIGGILGIILGILAGNLVAMLIGSPFIVPWLWIIGGVVLCLIVGIISGMFPAIKASKLDPIIALHYE
jgi:putative ABC transport system permease protein